MKEKIVFISSQVKPRRLREFLAQKGSTFRIILVDGDSLNKFSEFDVESIKPYQEKSKRENNYWDIAVEWTDGWNRRTQFYKKVMYEGFSLWWFERVNSALWLQGALADVDAVAGIIGAEKPEQVFLIEVDTYWQDVIQCVTTQADISVEIVEQRGIFAHLSNYRSWLARVKTVVPLLLVEGLRAVQGMVRILRGKFEGKRENQTKILMFTHSLDWQKLDSAGDKPRYFDAQLGQVLRQLLERGTRVVALDMMGHPKDGLRTFLQKRYPYVPQEGYVLYLFKAFNRVREERQRVITTWEDMKKEPNFWQGNLYKNIDITSLIDKKINSFIIKDVHACIRIIEFHKFILNKEKPAVVVIMDEYISGRPLATAARILKIPTVGFQHGSIFETHVGYVYPKDVDKETIPLTDKVVVFGDYYKEILTKQSIYEESEVEVTGQSRLDFLTQKDFNLAGKGILSSGLPQGKKILLFTSGAGIGQLVAPVLMKGLSQLGSDYFLIIKLHPGESLAKPYYEAAREYKVENFLVVKQVDLYELLALCDLHISVHSTVLSEAVVFGKPNLILGVPGSFDAGKWVEQGVAMNLSDFSSLKEAVETILGNEELGEKLRRAREGYIQGHYYRLDGKATERVCNLILSLKQGGQ